MSELDARQQQILRAVILEYVTHAEPVGSETIAEKYELGVKSATVRSELAEMAELGFLEQPHTSSGRIPSDKGYRYYVDRLVVFREPGSEKKQRVREASDDSAVLLDLLRETTKVLSRLTLTMSAATTVRDADITLRSVLVSALSPERALLVLVLSNGHVENRMVECPAELTLTDVGVVNELLAQGLAGKSVRSLMRTRGFPSTEIPARDRLLGSILAVIRAVARDLTRGQVIVVGEEFMFAQPELARNQDRIRDVVTALENEEELYGVLSQPAGDGQNVTIGRENRMESLRALSVIRQRFFVGEDEAGTLAIIGPARLNYDAAIPMVDFAAKALSETLTKLFRPSEPG